MLAIEPGERTGAISPLTGARRHPRRPRGQPRLANTPAGRFPERRRLRSRGERRQPIRPEKTTGAFRTSALRDVGGVQPLVAVLNLEFDSLSFLQRLESVHLDCREVHEHIVSALLFDEAISLGVIEPLHLPSGHSTASCGVTRSSTMKPVPGKPPWLARPIYEGSGPLSRRAVTGSAAV